MSLRDTACRVCTGLLLALAGPAFAAWPTDPHLNLAIPIGTGGASGPTVLADGLGGVFIGGLNGAGQPVLQHVTGSGALDPAWPAAGRVLGPAHPAATLAPLLVADGLHGCIATWRDGGCLRCARLYATGSVAAGWPDSGLAVCAGDALGALAGFAVASDSYHGVIVAWFDAANALHSVYAERVDGNGVIDPDWPAGWATLHTGSTALAQPVMLPDGGGGAYLAWTDYITTTGNIVGQHVLSNGSRDPSWGVNGNTICDASGTQSAPALAPDGAGGLYVAWQDERANPGQPLDDIYLVRLQGSGLRAAGWPLGGRALCAAPGAQTGVALASDDSGGVFAAWTDGRGADLDLYATRSLPDPDPAPGWPVDGLAVRTATGDQGPLRLVQDGWGGAIAAWGDARSPATGVPDLYAQRLLPRGAVDPAWTANGVALSLAAGGQTLGSLTADGAGGAIAAWSDTRGAQPAIAAQRVANSGALGGDVVIGVPPAPPPLGGGAAPVLRAVPNPARAGAVTWRFVLPRAARVRLTLHDARGRLVRTLAEGVFEAGEHAVRWDGTDAAGRAAAPGVYLARLATGTGEATVRRVVILGRPEATGD